MTQEVTQLTISDLQSVIVIIDAAATRGAFKGEEFASIGSIRDKIAAFVKAAQEAEAVAPEPTAETE